MNKLILIFFSVILVGCSGDSGSTAPTSDCTTHMVTYSNNMVGMMDGTMTQTQCEAGYTALSEWCADNCEDSDTSEADKMCTDEFNAWTSVDFTATCETLIGGNTTTNCQSCLDDCSVLAQNNGAPNEQQALIWCNANPSSSGGCSDICN